MKLKKLICTILVICLCASATCICSFATSNSDTSILRYTGLVDVSSALDISTLGKASCFSQAIVRSGYTANLTMELQQFSDSGWGTIKTWTSSGSPSTSLDKIWYVVSGSYYRVLATADVYTASGTFVESVPLSSGSKYY